jgi:dTDP-4-amino-4,6-dideoxygalactose transaminase
VRPALQPHTTYNYSYHPILLPSEEALLKVRDALNAQEITPRRYFYPSLNTLNYVRPQAAPVSEDVSTRVLCLPLYYDLEFDQVRLIASIINQAL